MTQAFSLLIVPIFSFAPSPGSEPGADDPPESEAMISDGDPGVVDVEPAPASNPVQRALAQLPYCGPVDGEPMEVPNLAQLFAEIPSESIVLAIEDGEVLRPMLRNAIQMVANFGTDQELTYLWDYADDISWSYVVAPEDAPPDAVFQASAAMSSEIRGNVLWSWFLQGQVPDQLLLDGLLDADIHVRSRAAHVIFDYGDAALMAEAHAACDLDPVLAEATSGCGG